MILFLIMMIMFTSLFTPVRYYGGYYGFRPYYHRHHYRPFHYGPMGPRGMHGPMHHGPMHHGPMGGPRR